MQTVIDVTITSLIGCALVTIASVGIFCTTLLMCGLCSLAVIFGG